MIPQNEKIAIGIPRGSDTKYSYEWIESLFSMFGTSPCNYKMISSSKVHHIARNEIIKMFLESDMNYLLFIDSDMIWEPDSLLLAYNTIQHPSVDMVTAIYYTKNEPHLPVIKKLDLDAGCYNVFTSWGNEPFEVDGAGMGFFLIKRKVLEAMKQPMCTWDGGFSEDLNFCLKAKKDYGFKIWAHPAIKVGHVGEKVVTSFDWIKQHKPSVESWIREAMRGTTNYLRLYYPDWKKTLGIHPLNFANINTKQYWDRIYELENGKDTWRTYPQKYQHVVKDLMKDAKKVLELGCGVGMFADVLLREKPEIEYKGMDISKFAVQTCLGRGLQAEERKVPPIGEKGYDYVVSFEFLEHLDDDPRLQTIKEISEIIGDTGTAIMSVPDNCFSPDEIAEHRTMYDKEGFEEFLKQAFKNVSVESFLTKVSHKALFGMQKFLIAVCSNKGVDKK